MEEPLAQEVHYRRMCDALAMEPIAAPSDQPTADDADSPIVVAARQFAKEYRQTFAELASL